MIKKLSALLVLSLWAATALAADPSPHAGWAFQDLRLTPVQSGGRIKPLDSFAREAVLFETGSRKFEGWDPIDLVFSWLADPQYWQGQKFVRIARADVRRQIDVDEKREMFTPAELFNNFALLQYAKEIDQSAKGVELLSGKTDRGPKESPREQELRQVLQRLELFREIIAGTAWTIVPMNDHPWLSIAETSPTVGAMIREHFIELVKAYQAGDASGFEHSARLTRGAVEGEITGWGDHEKNRLAAEVFYNRLRPFQYAWILYLLATILWLFAPKQWNRGAVKAPDARMSRRSLAAGWVTLAAFAFHTLGFGLRCYIAGRPPVTNMYESIVWVSYGTLIFATILLWIQKNSITLIVACALATLGLIAAAGAPAMLDPGLHPLVPVLRSNYWLTIHVLTITLSYSAFALTLGLANVTLFNFFRADRARKAGDVAAAQQAQLRISSLNLLTYRAMQFGIVLVAAGTILGGVWADYSWGRFWGWDPKEVWALIVTLTYLAIVHGRMTNWIGPFAFAVCSVLGFLSVMTAWYGVNFILGVGLHSYGFSTGGSGWVAGFSGLQLFYVAVIGWHHMACMRALRAPRPVAAGT